MKTQRERHYVERMLSRRCYRSIQIFTGLRAISPLQINGAIGNERGSARATAITASWYHKSRLPHIPRPYEARYLTHTRSRARTYARVIINAAAGMQGVAVCEDYRFAKNKTMEIFYRDLKLDTRGVLEKFLSITSAM